MTVEEAYDYWEEHHCKPEGMIKIHMNRQNVRNHVKPVLEQRVVNHITRSHWLIRDF